MNKVNYILILILTLNLSCAENHNSSDSENTDFEILVIDLWTGDESYFNKRMEFKKNGNEYYGEMINPKYYIGTKAFAPSELKVDEKGLRMLSEFWTKAFSFKDGCDEKYISSSIQNYTVIKNSDTIKINKFCNWDSHQYNIIEKELFSDYFEKLTENRKKLEIDLNTRLSGEWYPNKISRTMQRGDTLILTKKPLNSNYEDCSWVFDKNYTFENKCKNLLDIWHSKEYNWDIDEGSILFAIEDASIEKVNGDEITYENLNYGAHFKVNSFLDNELTLIYLWD
jgi:hypothetical protein